MKGAMATYVSSAGDDDDDAAGDDDDDDDDEDGHNDDKMETQQSLDNDDSRNDGADNDRSDWDNLVEDNHGAMTTVMLGWRTEREIIYAGPHGRHTEQV